MKHETIFQSLRILKNLAWVCAYTANETKHLYHVGCEKEVSSTKSLSRPFKLSLDRELIHIKKSIGASMDPSGTPSSII